MEDLDALLADLENTRSQFKTTYAETAPGNAPPVTSVQQPRYNPAVSPASPIYSEIPNGFSPVSSKQFPRSQPQVQVVQQTTEESHLYSDPYQYDQIGSNYNPNNPPPKPARPRILSNNQTPQDPNYSQPANSYQPQHPQPQHHQQNKMANLAELDNLLQDLEAAQYQFKNNVSSAPPPKPSQFPSDSRGQPPAVAPKPKSPARSAPSQNGAPAPPPLSTRNQQQVDSSQPPRSASSATRELDDLMASLSDFKVSQQPAPIAAQSEPQYAQPLKQSSQMQSAEPQPQQQQVSSGGSQLDSMLGSLHSDVSKQGVNTVVKGNCAACNKQIIGQIVTALGQTWHPEHFVCSICDGELGSVNFFEREGKPYCEKDYHEKFAPKCAYCNGPILDSCITAVDLTFHPEHFFCADCGNTFGDGGFYEKDGKTYCRDDYFKLFGPKCGGCHNAIIDNYIAALNTHWHPHCFCCQECKQPFDGGSFFEHNGLPYCEMHYHAKRGSLCSACSKPITGRCITAMHRKFHPEHFLCSFCMKQLNKGTFKEQNDKPYCHACFVKLFS